jgi:hypothetical protein
MTADIKPAYSRDEQPIVKPREGQITRAEELKEGKSYLYMARGVSREVIILKGPHFSEERLLSGEVVDLRVEYSEREISRMAVRPPTIMVLPLLSVGIMDGG